MVPRPPAGELSLQHLNPALHLGKFLFISPHRILSFQLSGLPYAYAHNTNHYFVLVLQLGTALPPLAAQAC